MRNIRLIIAYDGGAYSGWQRQPNAPTVQGAIEAILAQMTQSPCRLRGAGRTDAGVHAEGQVASFSTESTISCERFLRGLNALLPDDIAVRDVADVATTFNPRHDNHGKHYRYSLYNGQIVSIAQRPRAYHIRRPLAFQAMALAARRFVGEHDFAAFRAADCDRETTVRKVWRCTVTADPPHVRIDVEGTAFLKNMVRIIAGTLIEVGQGKRDADSIDALLARGDRTEAGVTAPAHGLCLVRVFL